MGRVKIIAHCGYAGKYPGLTRLAYQKALELPIHGVETDVRLTKDGHLVCFHDPIVNFDTDGSGRTSTFTLAELRELNMGDEDNPQTIMTLSELIDLVLEYPGKHLYIELKHPNRYGRMVEEAVYNVLRHKGLEEDERMHVISFSPTAMVRMAKLAPEVRRILLRRPILRYFYPFDPKFGQPFALGLSLVRAHIHPKLIGSRGLATYMWTVNEATEIAWAARHGAEMLTTDEPELAVWVLAGMNKSAAE